MNLEVSATTNLKNERKNACFRIIYWFYLAWNLGRNWLLTSYFPYFLCRLKFNGFTSKKNLSSVNISSLWRKTLSCSAKRTELQIIYLFFILDLYFRPRKGTLFMSGHQTAVPSISPLKQNWFLSHCMRTWTSIWTPIWGPQAGSNKKKTSRKQLWIIHDKFLTK